MASLIITIISLALFAVVAIMAIYYGGQAYQNAQINVTANAIMNEAQQILAAERIWSTNNGQLDISGMGTAGASGTGMSALVNGNELSSWPSFGGTMGVSASLTNPGPQPWMGVGGVAGTISTGSYDYGCYSINGYYGRFIRTIFSYNNGNYVLYTFYTNLPYSAPCTTSNGKFNSSVTDISQINHPIVQITKAINAAMNQISSSASTATMPYIGLPTTPTGGTFGSTTTVYDPSRNYSNKGGWPR